MRSIATSFLVLATVAVVVPCTETQAQTGPVIRTLTGKISMATLVDACQQTASAAQAGAVVIDGRLQDANCNATLTVPCAVQLAARTSVRLTNCTVQSRTLNISDTATSAGTNSVTLTNVVLVGQGDVGLLIRLTDPQDKIALAKTSATYERGIVLQALGSRTTPDQGGKVQLRASRLTASSVDSRGINLAASTRKGSVTVVNSELTAPSVVLLADRCRTTSPGKRADCRASTTAANLARQAQMVAGP